MKPALLNQLLLFLAHTRVALCEEDLSVTGLHAQELHEGTDYGSRAEIPKTSTGPGPVPMSRRPCSTALEAASLAFRAAVSGSAPRASQAASVELCVQPEPCAAPS